MTLGERLRYARTLAGLGTKTLDYLAGLGAGHVAMTETGRRRRPRPVTIDALIRVLGIERAWLLDGEGPPPDPVRVRAYALAAALELATGKKRRRRVQR